MSTRYSRILGTGRYLPERVLTNHDLEQMVETSDEWIRARTGIERRHIAADDQTTCDLAEQAARQAMDAAGVEPGDIDFIVVGTTTPDVVFPNMGCLLQERLGIRGCAAFSVEAACSRGRRATRAGPATRPCRCRRANGLRVSSPGA